MLCLAKISSDREIEQKPDVLTVKNSLGPHDLYKLERYENKGRRNFGEAQLQN